MNASVIFQLWDLESANLIADHNTEDAALACVREVIRSDGRAYVDNWDLARAPVGEDATSIAAGAELLPMISGPRCV